MTAAGHRGVCTNTQAVLSGGGATAVPQRWLDIRRRVVQMHAAVTGGGGAERA